MSDEPLKTCPECGKEVRRLIFGGTGVIFKGSGFYVTDKNNGRNGAATKSKPKTEGTSSGDAATVSGDKAGSCAQCPAASSATGCPAGTASGGGAKSKATSAAAV